MSTSVTSSAAPWFTNGFATSDFGYGNDTMRFSGVTVTMSASSTAVRDHAYGLAAATRDSSAHMRPDSAWPSANDRPSWARNAFS